MRQYLVDGNTIAFLGMPEPTEAEVEQAWMVVGEQLMEQHIREHPGSRPWGWWRYEANEPRRLRPGADDPASPGCREFSMGLPRFLKCDAPWPEYKNWYETELDYLDRRGLLKASERQALAVTTR